MLPVLAIMLVAAAVLALSLLGARGSLAAVAGPDPRSARAAISHEAAEEAQGEIHINRIDYVGEHDDGAGSVAYIYYVYFSGANGLQDELFVRVLRTADGTLHVMRA